MKTLIFLFLINWIAFGEVSAFTADDIRLWVFAERNGDLQYTEFRMLEQLGFRKDLPTVVVVHGYQSGYTFIEEFQKAFRYDILRTMNLIGIDWSEGASTPWYPTAAERTRLVGDAVGEFIISAIVNDIMQSDVHVIGHSLGAHVAGFIGKYMASKDFRMDHLTALDPAGPIFENYECLNRLCNTDARYVEIVHSNGGTLGMMAEIEPLDLYLNGGRSQPDCWNPECSHSYSHEWYRQKLHEVPIRGWKCNSLNQMEREKYCDVGGNPREYKFEIMIPYPNVPEHPGITYIPTGTTGRFTDSPRRTTFSSNRSNMNTTRSDDYTLVVFGTNDNTVNEFVSLLSDDGHLQVQLSADKVTLTNPTNFAWRPDPKYVIFSEKRPEAIDDFLSKLRRPYRFVVPFDIYDMFTDSFWMTLRRYAEVQNSAMHDSAPNELKTIAMHLPHDNIPLKDHLDDLKRRIDYGLRYSAEFEMLGMHAIEKSGPVNTMPQLVAEVAAIKGPVGLV